jgi:hypothetical protein
MYGKQKIAVFWVVAPCSLVKFPDASKDLLPPSSGQSP